jgi:hypothetical protein
VRRYSDISPNLRTNLRPDDPQSYSRRRSQGCGCLPYLLVLFVILALLILAYGIVRPEKASNYQTARTGQKIAQMSVTLNQNATMNINLTLYNPDGSVSDHKTYRGVKGDTWVLSEDVIHYPSLTNMQPEYKIVALTGEYNTKNVSSSLQRSKSQFTLNGGEDAYYKAFQALSWAQEYTVDARPLPNGTTTTYIILLNSDGSMHMVG